MWDRDHLRPTKPPNVDHLNFHRKFAALRVKPMLAADPPAQRRGGSPREGVADTLSSSKSRDAPCTQSGPDGGLGIESPSRGPTERPGLIEGPGRCWHGRYTTRCPRKPGGRSWQEQLAPPREALEWAPWGWSSLSGRRDVGLRRGGGSEGSPTWGLSPGWVGSWATSSRNQRSGSVWSYRVCVCLRAQSLQSCSILRNYGLLPARPLQPWDPPGKDTGVGCHALLQGIFLTQGSNRLLQEDSSLLQADSLPLSHWGRWDPTSTMCKWPASAPSASELFVFSLCSCFPTTLLGKERTPRLQASPSPPSSTHNLGEVSHLHRQHIWGLE